MTDSSAAPAMSAANTASMTTLTGASDANPRHPRHFPALDGLRGIAILMVLVHQLGMLDDRSTILNYLFGYAIGTGWAGVQLFFVLSGFLITGILLDTQKSTNYFSGFYARRTLRIFPLYYGALALAFIVLPAFGIVSSGVEKDWNQQIWLWTYLVNWVEPVGIGSHTFPHFWSLAVEEQFYLLWPLLLALPIYRASVAACIRLCVMVAVISLAARFIFAWNGDGRDEIYLLTICRIDALVIGAAFAALMRMPELPNGWRRIMAKPTQSLIAGFSVAIVGVLVTHGFSFENFLGETIGFTLLALAFGLVIMAAACADLRSIDGVFQLLRLAPLRSLGKYSYAMYVFHKPLHDLLGRPLLVKLRVDMAHSLLAELLYIAGSVVVLHALALLSYHLFEKHFLNLKRFFIAKPASHPPRTVSREM